MSKRIATAEARASLKNLIGEVQRKGGRVKITRYGQTAAYLVPVEDGRLLEDCGDELAECKKRRRRAG